MFVHLVSEPTGADPADVIGLAGVWLGSASRPPSDPPPREARKKDAAACGVAVARLQSAEPMATTAPRWAPGALEGDRGKS
jgi:hypothetical protein